MDSNLLGCELTLLKCFAAFGEWGYLEQMFCASSEWNTYLYMLIKQMIKARFHVLIHLFSNEISVCQELKCYDNGIFNYSKLKCQIICREKVVCH